MAVPVFKPGAMHRYKLIAKIVLSSLLIFSLSSSATAQVFTFQCVDSTILSGANCDVCPPVGQNTSRSFCGLLISKNGTPYKWIDQPYTIRVKGGDLVEYLEQIPSIPSIQTQDKITIYRGATPFFTVKGMVDSTFCHCSSGQGSMFYASDSINLSPINKGDTLTIVGRNLAQVTFDSLLKKYVINVDSISGGGGIDTVKAIQPAAGLVITGSPGVAPVVTLTFSLANDLAAIEALTGNGIPARTGTDTWVFRTITAGTGISVADGNGVAGNPTITNTGDLSNTNEIQFLDTFTIVSNILRASLSNDGVPFVSVDLSSYVNVGTDLTFTGGASPYSLNSSTGTDVTFTSGAGITMTRLANDLSVAAIDPSTTNEIQTYTHSGTTSYTNTLSLGGGAVTFLAAGIFTISHTAGTVTMTATEAQIANNGLSDNEGGGGIFRLGNRYMNSSDGLFSFDRKVNINAFRLFIGDNSDSTLLLVDGINDRIGIGISPIQRVDISGSSGTYARISTAGAVANSGFIINNSADLNASWALYRQNDGDLAIGSSDGEWPSGTLTDPILIKPNPPNNSLYMDASGNVQLNGTSPQRRLHVTGEVRITDLVTDNPTILVGADADGDLTEVQLGSSLSFSGSTLNATGGSNYQTLKDDGTAFAVQPIANFVSTGRVSTLLVNDNPNTETEVSFDIVANSIGNTHIRQGVARSVIGVTGNALANVADIQSGGADLPLVTNGANTAISFAQLATGGIADDAVTYAKLQNISVTTRWLGRITAGAGNAEELTLANMYTMLGLTGVANRFAIWTGANTLTTNAAYTFDGTNGRMTITPTAAGLGAGLAGLNISTGALGSMEFLQMRGAINGNLIAGQYNTNNASATAHSFYTVSSGGTAAGDAFTQYQIAGAGGVTTSVGLDNSDGDKLKLTPNSTTPGGTINHGIILTNDAVTLVGVNKDAPAFPFDVGGKERSEQYHGLNVAWGAGDFFFGLGAGTAPTFTGMTGTHNWVRVLFKTGTAPTANNVIFSVVRKSTHEFALKAFPIISAGNANTAGEFTKFYVGGDNGITWNIVANGTLTASTDYELVVCFSGY